ncbi:MAG: Tetratricopeptide repeat protein [Chloroflexi bacterium OLB15]|nr:MAG: Tetratricopeptide repeat protein [Chloroflexi bacterium OLB15]
MFYLLNRVLRDFSNWERPLRWTILSSLALLLILSLIILFGPYELRLPACIGAFGLIALSQVAVMLAYRDMVSPLVKAQRDYLANDFEAAKTTLEELLRQGKADVRALTVLGNTYRQLGDLEASKAVLYEALNKNPEHQFPLYGIGRTLLSEGDYVGAVDALQRALAAGAPEVTRLDLAEALYRIEHDEEARAVLAAVDPQILDGDPARLLMFHYLNAQVTGADAKAAFPLEGLPFWEAMAERFSNTRYGRDLAVDVKRMQGVDAS